MRLLLVATLPLIVADLARAAESVRPSSPATPGSADLVTIRTESYPRPPYSGATYYLYERGGRVVCTKLEVCNKFDDCETTYHRGRYRATEDVQTGDPYGRTDAVPIAPEKLRRHQCLVKFPPG